MAAALAEEEEEEDDDDEEEGDQDFGEEDEEDVEIEPLNDDRRPLPPGWQRVPADDGTGDFYFWNENTDETTWEFPG